jgi:subtilase family serine protease
MVLSPKRLASLFGSDQSAFGLPASAKNARRGPAELLEQLENRQLMTADLVVSSFSAPTLVNPGQVVNFSLAVRNAGTSNATATSTLRIVLSRDAELGNGDDQIVDTVSIGAIPAGATFTPPANDRTFTVPGGTAGSYTLFAVADVTNAVPESNELNNHRSQAFAVRAADLTLPTVTVPGGPFNTGQNVQLAASVRNAGNLAIANGTTVVTDFVLSRDNVFGNSDDLVLGTASFDSGLTVGQTRPLTAGDTTFAIPSGATGVYFLLARVNPGNAILESNGANNTFATSGPQVVVNSTSGAAVDLTGLTSYSPGAFLPGADLDVTTTLRSLAGAAGSLINPISVRYVLSTIYGNADDVEIGSEDVVDEVSVGSNVTITPTLTIPSGIALGNYRLLTVVDQLNEFVERNEGNNIAVSTSADIVVGRPDLQVTITGGGGSVAQGGVVTATITLRNAGAVDTDLPGSAQVSFVRVGAGPAISSVVTIDFTSPGVNRVRAGGVVTLSNVQIPIPDNAAAGTYRLSVQLDGEDDINEGTAGEANNTVNAAATVTVRAATPAIPARVDTRGFVNTTTQRVAPGTAVSIDFGIFNQGATTANPLGTPSFVLSLNSTFGDADDVALTPSLTLPSSLATGGFIRLNEQTVTVPTSAPAGTYRVLMRQATVAGDATDDVAVSAGQITVQRADLAGSLSVRGATVAQGQSLNSTITIRNAGQVASGISPFTVVLSTDQTAGNGDDIVIATGSLGNLQAGQSVALPFGTVVPRTVTAGAYRLFVRLDPGSLLEEANEGNNTLPNATGLAVTVTPGAGTGRDLFAGIAGAAQTVSPGQSVTVFTQHGNSGTANTTAAYTRTLLLSRDTVLDPSDVELFSETIGVGQPGSVAGQTVISAQSAVIPEATPSGRYFILHRNDSNDNITDLATANNSAVTPAAIITVSRPTVTVAATTAAAAEVSAGQPQRPAVFTFTRTGPTTLPLAVTYAMSGTAAQGGDYGDLAGFVVFPAGRSTVTVTLNVIDDSVGESSETAILTLTEGANYTVGTARVATANIADNEATVTVTATDALAAATSPVNTGTFRFARVGGDVRTSQRVNYTISGTAINGTDYSTLSGFTTIPVGATFVDVTLTPTRDVAFGAVSATLAVDTSGAVAYKTPAGGSSGTVTIGVLPAPNLQALNVNVGNPTTLSRGGANASGSGTFSFRREGLLGTVGEFDVQIRLSRDGVAGDDDITLFTFNVAEGYSGSSLNTAWSIDWDDFFQSNPTIELGEYRLYVIVDSGNAVAETSNLDNVFFGGQRITINA